MTGNTYDSDYIYLLTALVSVFTNTSGNNNNIFMFLTSASCNRQFSLELFGTLRELVG